MDDPCTWWVVFEVVVIAMVAFGSIGPFLESASTIGAYIVQKVPHAIRAKGALKGTNHGICYFGGKGLLAMFTTGSEF